MFNEHVKKAAAISSIVPQYMANKNYDDLAPALEIYQKFLPGSQLKLNQNFYCGKKGGHKFPQITILIHYHPLQSATTIHLQQNVKKKQLYLIQR